MRRFLPFGTFLACLLFISCSKSNHSGSQVTCLINDTAYSFSTSSIVKDTSNGIYWLQATDDKKNEISIRTLYPGLGWLSSTGSPPSTAYIQLIHYNDLQYSFYVTDTLPGTHSGLADGTFSGFMLQVSPSGNHTIQITHGVFKNVPIK